jgi:hypothetical protein
VMMMRRMTTTIIIIIIVIIIIIITPTCISCVASPYPRSLPSPPLSEKNKLAAMALALDCVSASNARSITWIISSPTSAA